MATSTEHDGWIWKSEPVAVVDLQVAYQFCYEGIVFASHHKSDREASRMSSRCNEAESSEGSQRACAFQVHVKNRSFCHNQPAIFFV